jgi:hypothetical protein
MNISTAWHWTCPYCNRDTTLGAENFSGGMPMFDDHNKYGRLGLKWQAITCPNPSCREVTLTVWLHHTEISAGGKITAKGDAIDWWQLRPASTAKVFPSYIPKQILEDYAEACAVRDLSPKASATLSRRCLQGMIRNFWGITKSRLIDEIDALQDKVDAETWEAIDAVRNIGNVGAHMEKDINVIVDVDPAEAQLLIGLIETLLKEWYVARQDRKERMGKIVSAATVKKPNAVRKAAAPDDEAGS